MSTRIDFNFNMTPHPLTGDLAQVSGSRAIFQAVKNIVLTNFSERGFEPNFGSGVKGLLFELNTPTTINAIKDNIKTALANYELDIEVVGVDAVWDDSEQGYTVYIHYTELNDPEVITASISLVSLVR